MSVCRSSSCLFRVAPSLISPSSLGGALPRYFHKTIVPRDENPGKAPPLRPRRLITAEQDKIKYAAQRQKQKDGFRPYSDEEMAALKQYYTPQQIEALEASEKAIDLDDLVEQGVPRIDHWAIGYQEDDLSKRDPLLDMKVLPEVTDAPRMRQRVEDEFEQDVSERMVYGGMGMSEMYYAIERSEISDKMKAGLRTLKRWKGTPKENAVKEILWKFVPKAANSIQTKDGETSVTELFDTIELLDLPAVKKAEIAALRHWQGTEKESALRPMLERFIANTPRASTTLKGKSESDVDMSKLHEMITQKLGFNPTDDLWFVEGRGQKNVLNDDVYSVKAAQIPKFKEPGVRYKAKEEDDAVRIALARLSLQTGQSVDNLRRFRTKTVVSHRVGNMTRMGKIYSIYSLTVAGNENGMLGIGQGKSAEHEDSRIQSYVNAIRNMKPIHRYENRTIYGEVEGKVGGTSVQLSARPPGFGLRTQHLIFEIARCAGIRDLSARVGRSRNRMNTVKATVEALTSQRLPEEIARARGKKLVDVRKVYYGGTVY